MNDNTEITIIHTESIFGVKHQRGLVKIDWNEQSLVVTTEEARNIGHDIIESAHAADIDECVYKWLQGKLNLSLEQAATILMEFRQFRAEKMKPYRVCPSCGFNPTPGEDK